MQVPRPEEGLVGGNTPQKKEKKMKPTYDELLAAIRFLVEEIDTWELPQVDDDGLYGPDTAVGHARTLIEQHDRT